MAGYTLRFVKLTPNAKTPTRNTPSSAGLDLYSAYDYSIPARGKCLCMLDLQLSLPKGCYGRIAPRSGLANTHFIHVGAGVIDNDFRGNIGVLLFNFAENEFTISKGDKIAQLILEKIILPEIQEEITIDTNTARGTNGFGSSGLN